jgi:hypothetical protein
MAVTNQSEIVADNTAVLNAASSRIDQLDVALARFYSLGEQKIKLQADLKIAEAQEETILSNESLSYDVGAQQLAQCRSSLDVIKRRLESVSEKIGEAQKAVFDAGAQAQQAAFSVWAKLRENREERAKAVFAEHFALPSHWPVPVHELWEQHATLVKEVRPLQFGFQLQVGHSTEASLDRLRTLRGRFDSLRRIVEVEPGIDLESIAKAPALSVVSRAA